MAFSALNSILPYMMVNRLMPHESGNGQSFRYQMALVFSTAACTYLVGGLTDGTIYRAVKNLLTTPYQPELPDSWSEVEVPHLEIENDHYHTLENRYFLCVRWFLNRQSFHNGKFKAVRVLESREDTSFHDGMSTVKRPRRYRIDVIHPANAFSGVLGHRDNQIRVLYYAESPNRLDTTATQSERHGASSRQRESYILRHPSLAVLRDFLECTSLMYEEEVERIKQDPVIHHWDDCAGWRSTPIRNPKNFDNVALSPSVKNLLRSDLDTFLRSENWYSSRGLRWTRRYFFHGNPGTGKTSLIEAMSNHGKLPIYSLSLQDVSDDNHLRKAFNTLPERCMVMLEDVDAMGTIAHRRSSGSSVPVGVDSVYDSSRVRERHMPSGVTLQCLLNCIDGVSNSHCQVLVMTTNHVDKIDPALLRPGRADIKLEMGDCDVDQVKDFLKIYYHTDGLTEDQARRLGGIKIRPCDVSNILILNMHDREAAIEQILNHKSPLDGETGHNESDHSMTACPCSDCTGSH
jgi:hypothetical protein